MTVEPLVASTTLSPAVCVPLEMVSSVPETLKASASVEVIVPPEIEMMPAVVSKALPVAVRFVTSTYQAELDNETSPLPEVGRGDNSQDVKEASGVMSSEVSSVMSSEVETSHKPKEE